MNSLKRWEKEKKKDKKWKNSKKKKKKKEQEEKEKEEQKKLEEQKKNWRRIKKKRTRRKRKNRKRKRRRIKKTRRTKIIRRGRRVINYYDKNINKFPILLIGNWCDVEESERKISKEEAIEIASEENLLYIETSMKENIILNKNI